MRSHSKGSLSAATEVHPVRYLFDRVNPVTLLLSNRVKVLSPEIFLVALGQGFHFPETNIRTHAKGDSVSDVPGSESAAGKRTAYVGTWENQIVLKRSFQEVEKMTRKYGGLVVGLIHSRGVNIVMQDNFSIVKHIVNITEEPDVGNLQVLFCEGH